MKTLNKLFGAALALVLAFAPVASYAETESSSPNQGASFGGLHNNLIFMGVKVKRIILSSTDAQLFTGEGFLDAICPFGGTLGKYSMAYDTAASTYNDFGASSSANVAVSPMVYTNTDSTSNDANKGCWIPPAPIKIVNGLRGEANDSGHVTLFLVHCSTGTNPCQM